MAPRAAQSLALLLATAAQHAAAGGLRGASSEPFFGYTFYANSNAYEGHGAVDRGQPEGFAASVEGCLERCTLEAACDCVTYGSGMCYLRGMCVPAEFEAPTQQYDVYVKALQEHLQQPAFDAFTYHPSSNSYAPNFAKENLDDVGVPNLTAAECTLRCVAEEACDCVAFEAASGTCWMRGGCFGLQQGLAAKAYAVYSKSKAVKCVQSPLEYQRTYAVGKEKCVSPSLLVSANGDGISPYPQPGFLFAWANTNANLEMYLRLNRLYNLTSPLKVALGISAIAGLPVDPASLEKNNGLLGHLGVYVLPEGERPSVPSLGFWFSFLAEYGMTVDVAVQKELVEAYQFVPTDGDVVNAYASVVHCTNETVLDRPKSCPAIKKVDALCKDAYNNSQPSTECFRGLFRAHPSPSAADIRVALQRCQDNNAFQTFMGYGYNSYLFPLNCGSHQTVKERYTGKEVVLRNRNFSDFPDYADLVLKGADDVKSLEALSGSISEFGWCAGERWWPQQ